MEEKRHATTEEALAQYHRIKANSKRNKTREYPEDYIGPKAGLSNHQEWLDVTEFQAFKYMRNEVWFYSDFDCWLGARDKKAFENAHKIRKIED